MSWFLNWSLSARILYQNFVYSISLNYVICPTQPDLIGLLLMYSELTFYECTNLRKKQFYYIWPAVSLRWISVPSYTFLPRHLESSNNCAYDHIASAIDAEIHSVRLPGLFRHLRRKCENDFWDWLLGWEVDGTKSGSCPLLAFGNSICWTFGFCYQTGM
jgi:hypothetical protein